MKPILFHTFSMQMIYQERNPGISYEYVVPNPPGQKEERPPPGGQEEGGRQTSQQVSEEVVPCHIIRGIVKLHTISHCCHRFC